MIPRLPVAGDRMRVHLGHHQRNVLVLPKLRGVVDHHAPCGGSLRRELRRYAGPRGKKTDLTLGEIEVGNILDRQRLPLEPHRIAGRSARRQCIHISHRKLPLFQNRQHHLADGTGCAQHAYIVGLAHSRSSFTFAPIKRTATCSGTRATLYAGSQKAIYIPDDRHAAPDERGRCGVRTVVHYSAATTASPIAAVPRTSRSRGRRCRRCDTPAPAPAPPRRRCASAPLPRRTCSAASSPRDSIVASGLATFLPAMSGAEPWIGSYRPLPRRIERGRGQHADRAGQHRRLVGQDVAEHVAGDDARRTAWDARTSCIAALSTYMCESSTSGYSFATSVTTSRHSTARLEHVRLVHRAELAAALHARRCRSRPAAMRRISGSEYSIVS